MAAIPYVGATQAATTDLVNRSYLGGLLSLNLLQSVVDTLINTSYSGYATKAYVDGRDALNATKSFIDAGDATRLHYSQVGVNNGIAPLDGLARIPIGRISTTSTQRFPKPFTSPSAYNAATVSAAGSEVQIYTCAVADPGFAYKLFVTGMADGSSNTDGEYALIKVRQGSSTGQIVAGGYGLGEKYVGGQLTMITTSQTYTVPTWATSLDIICLGGGAGGQGGQFFAGQGGNGGTFATSTQAKGSITSITCTIGNGGTAGDGGSPGSAGNGSASTATGTGLTTVSGAGGTNSNPFFGGTGTGLSPGTRAFNGGSYAGGAVQNTRGQPGNSPGGGGAGGALGPNPGGAGAPGAIWILAYTSPNSPSGPINIVPTAVNAQNSITGATTLYVMGVRSGSASTQSISTLRPGLFVVPFPA